jgi:glycogenin
LDGQRGAVYATIILHFAIHRRMANARLPSVTIANVPRLRRMVLPLLIPPLLLLMCAIGPLAANSAPSSASLAKQPSSSPSCPSSGPSCAYVTLISTEEYVVGARVVQRMLRHFGSSAPMIAMVQKGLPLEVQLDLEIDGWQVIHVTPLPNPNVARVRDRPWFATTYSKLHVFGLTQFDVVVFIDADTLPLANLDALFHMNTSYFAAAPEMMPPDTFNTGLMVVRPSPALRDRVMDARDSISSYDGSDQGFLNSLFSDWFAAGHRLPFHYNVLQSISWFYPPGWDRMQSSMKLLHFCGDASMKPWSYTQKMSGSLAKYVYLWQRVSWMEEHDDVNEFMWVLTLTDDKVMCGMSADAAAFLTAVSGNTTALGASGRHPDCSGRAKDMIYSTYKLSASNEISHAGP